MRFRLLATAALVAAVCLGAGIGWLTWGNDSPESEDNEAEVQRPTALPSVASRSTAQPLTPAPAATPAPGGLISVSFGPEQIWSFSDSRDSSQQGAIAALHDCAPRDADWNECVWQVMQQYGASRDAFEFFRLTDGFLEALQGEGQVKLGIIVYPWRANENVQPILLGGDPAVLRVENPSVQPSVEDDPDYKRLQREHPNIWFWPVGPLLESASVESDGSQSFIFRYRLLDGCHACDVLGYARVEYVFFPSGLLDITTPKLLGIIEKQD